MAGGSWIHASSTSADVAQHSWHVLLNEEGLVLAPTRTGGIRVYRRKTIHWNQQASRKFELFESNGAETVSAWAWMITVDVWTLAVVCSSNKQMLWHGVRQVTNEKACMSDLTCFGSDTIINRYGRLLRNPHGAAPQKAAKHMTQICPCRSWPPSPNQNGCCCLFLFEIQDAPVQISGHHCAGINSYLLQKCQSFGHKISHVIPALVQPCPSGVCQRSRASPFWSRSLVSLLPSALKPLKQICNI